MSSENCQPLCLSLNVLMSIHILAIFIFSIFTEIGLRKMPQDLTDSMSTLIWAMTW